MRRFEGKTVMITGCNRGIGRAMLEAFAREGADIIACTRKYSEDFETEIKRFSEENHVVIRQLFFDMASEDEIRNAIAEFKSWKLPLHVLVNNAGYAIFKGFMQLKQEEIKRVFQINFFSMTLLIQQLTMSMMKAKGASIINIGSIAGLDAPVGNTAYGTSKAAGMTLTKVLAKELASLKIRVNSIAPGFIDTDMNTQIDESIRVGNINSTSLKRLGAADEIADVVLFLASDDASYITGQIIRVDGGL